MDTYRREAIKNCKIVNDYKKKEDKLKKSGYIERRSTRNSRKMYRYRNSI